MMKIITNAVLFIIVALSLLMLSHGKVVRFQKTKDGSLQFAYRMNNGTVYNGYTFEFASKIRLIVDANGHWYWAEFSENELNSSRPFLKSVLPVNRTDEGLAFKDDYQEYELHIELDGDHRITIVPYITWWDFSYVCFDKINNKNNNNNQTLRFRLISTNNNLKYNGTTTVDAKNPLRHTFLVDDGHRMGEYEVEFTTAELALKKTICTQVTTLAETVTLGASTSDNIDPNLIKSLIG